MIRHAEQRLSASAEAALTKFILQPLADLVQATHQVLKESILGDLPVAQDGARFQDDGLLEADVLDGVLDTVLHLAVGGHVRDQTTGSGARDEHVSLDACLLGSPRVLDAEVMIDLPLVLDAASLGARGADGIEHHRRERLERCDHRAPFCRISLHESFEFGGFGLGCSAGNGLDGVEGVRGEQSVQDLGPYGARGPEDCCCSHLVSSLKTLVEIIGVWRFDKSYQRDRSCTQLTGEMSRRSIVCSSRVANILDACRYCSAELG